MRQIEVINKEINDLEKIIENGNALLKQFPDDNVMRLSILQAEHRKELLFKEKKDTNSSRNLFTIFLVFIASLFGKSTKKEKETITH